MQRPEPDPFSSRPLSGPSHGSGASDPLALEGDPDGYREIYEGVALPVLVIDSESWTIVSANDAALVQYGYEREELLGLSALMVRPPEGRADARRVLSEMPHGFWRTTAVRHQRKDGSTFDAEVWSRDTEVNGRSVRICTINDVTERVLLERELLQAQKMEAVGRLAGGVAHDFNNALTCILGEVDLLHHELSSEGGASAELEEIRGAAERAASLTRSLLAFSRRQVMRVETVSPSRLLREMDPLLGTIVGESVEVRGSFAEDAWPVRVDPNQLEQVVLNLVMNARDAMPGGGTLSLSSSNLSLDDDQELGDVAAPPGDYVELTVADTGIGMNEEVMARIFEPFFTTGSSVEGAGLGLSTAFGVVRQSGGFIDVESTPGRGSTFRVLLPRAEAEGAPPTG